jgi:hypothetical protein
MISYEKVALMLNKSFKPTELHDLKSPESVIQSMPPYAY